MSKACRANDQHRADILRDDRAREVSRDGCQLINPRGANPRSIVPRPCGSAGNRQGKWTRPATRQWAHASGEASGGYIRL